MFTTQLLHPGGKKVEAFACGVCQRTWFERDAADRCCKCQRCGKSIDPGDKSHFTSYHDNCWAEHSAAVDSERLAKAELVSDYDGWIYTPRGWGREGFFTDMGELVEYLLDEHVVIHDDGEESPEDDWPEFVHCCHQIKFPGIDIDGALECVAEQLYEDALGSFVGTEELFEAGKKFDEANKHVIAYEPDLKRKVAVPEFSDVKGDR